MKFQDYAFRFSRAHTWLAVLTLSQVAVATHAQELFRVGRPDYARTRTGRSNAAPTFALTPNRSTPLPSAHSPVVTTPRVYDRFRNLGSTPSCQLGDEQFVGEAFTSGRVAGQPDYERVQLAWENFQREVTEYRARYGGEGLAGPWTAAAPRMTTPWMPANARRGGPQPLLGGPGQNVLPTGLTEYDVAPSVRGYPNEYPGGRACAGRGCRARGMDLSPADLQPRLSRDVPVRPYRETHASQNDRRQFVGREAYDSLRTPNKRGPNERGPNERGQMVPVPKYRASTNSRRSLAPESRSARTDDGMDRWNSVEPRDWDSRDWDSRDRFAPIDPRNSARKPEATRSGSPAFSAPTPVQPIDPAKIASRARDFFRSHLSE